MYRLTLALTAALLTAGFTGNAMAAEKIYKTVDKYGNVIYSDKPADEAQDTSVQEIELTTPNTFDPADGVNREPWIVEGAATSDPVSEPAYQGLRITSPADDAAIRDNAGSVTVAVAVDPGLREGHSLRLLLDDVAIRQGSRLQFALDNVDRGSHSLRAEVIDEQGQVVLSSEPSRFHLHRYSRLTAPNRPAPLSGPG